MIRINKVNKFMALKDVYKASKEERKANSKFISIGSGESFVGRFISVEDVAESNFGPTRHYKFELEDGSEKIFNKASNKFLDAMVETGVTEGDTVEVKAFGEGFKRTYQVKIL
jgi:hypothetical protein